MYSKTQYSALPIAGFNLIELMVVIAIIAILVSAAIPKYQIYIQRSYINNSLAVVRPMQIALLEYFNRHSRLPQESNELSQYGLAQSDEQQYRSPIVEAIRYATGEQPLITLHYVDNKTVPESIRGKTLVLAPQINEYGNLDFRIDEQSSLMRQLWPKF